MPAISIRTGGVFPAMTISWHLRPPISCSTPNPVDWMPWGEAALARARREDRPIFLSVGYAACHWCHVMAHESFEDEATAARINQNFVAVKVDREERPDVDAVYMDAVVALTGQGGWPLVSSSRLTANRSMAARTSLRNPATECRRSARS
jgi:hypothetical protein